MQQVAPASDISICHEVNNKLPLFLSPVLNPLAWAVDALSLPWEDLDAYWWQSGGEAAGLSKQENHSDCSRVAQHAFALGPSGHIEPDPCVCPICPTCKHNIQADSPEESPNLYVWLLEPQLSRSRTALRQWQQELRFLKEEQPVQSMRQVDHFYKVVPQ